MVAFLVSYASRCAASNLSVATQRDMCDVLWRIRCGVSADDDETPVATMPAEFERRLVSQKGMPRMGILLYWQHGPGVDARVAACSETNCCGITRTQLIIEFGVAPRCARCG